MKRTKKTARNGFLSERCDGLPTNSSTLGEANRARVLGVVAKHGPISRASIARRTGLTPTAAGTIATELLQAGYLRRSQASLTGPPARRSILLELNSEYAHAIGVNVGITHITGVRIDLLGQLRARHAELIRRVEPQALLTCIEEMVHTLSAGASSTLLGVGIGLHGIVDPVTGLSRFAPHFGIRNWPIGELLQERLQIPVFVENGVRAMALGEHWFGVAKGWENFLCLAVGTGIGAAIVLNGRIYRGELGIAGEVGHTTVDVSGPRCACGNFGCLETFASGPAIARRALALIKQGRPSLIPTLVPDLDEVTAVTVGQAAHLGDSLAAQVIMEAGVYLGVAVANLANTLGLRRIVLGGGVVRVGEPLLGVVRETASQRVLGHAGVSIEIIPAALGEDAGALGAATLLLDRCFSTGRMPVAPYPPQAFGQG